MDDRSDLHAVEGKLAELELEHRRAIKSLRQQEHETESLLQVLRVLTESAETDTDISAVLCQLRGLLDFDQAFLLYRSDDGPLRVEAATHPSLRDLEFTPGEFFSRVLDGETKATFNVAMIPEWSGIDLDQTPTLSALHVPLQAGSAAGMLVCTHPERGHFGARLVELGSRFSPIASQILHFARLRADLRSERDSLEGRVQQRTEQLRGALDRARAADRAKSAFLANMSHEIRTPLNGIIAVAELLESEGSDPAQQELIDLIRRSGDDLLVVINDILDLSKVEAGKIQLEKRVVDVVRVAEDLLKLHQSSADEQGLECVLDVAPDFPERVVTDETRVRQILGNLLSNAIKFTTDGSVTVSLRPAGPELLRGEAGIEIAVTDTGIGIPQDAVDRLFQPFQQVDDSTTRRYGGTGLGLAISRHLSEMLGGTIDVESEVGVGSTFRFTIATSESVAADVASEPKVVGDTVPLPTRVLLVEDNEVNVMVATAMLEQLGISCDKAANGQEAVEQARRSHYDVILMDIQMPVMDGLEATRQIRAQTNGAELRPAIVALTAHALTGDREDCLAVGMDDFITKPLSKAELAQALRRVYPLAA